MTYYIVGMIFGSITMLLCLAFFIYIQLKNKKFKASIKRIGQSAEDQINADLKVWARHTKNIFIPASIYKYDKNKVFEVDSIIITSKALIVIEIKSIKGGIKGESDLSNWEKILGDNKYKISNPIIQNERHIDHIIKMTELKIPTISLVIFSNRATSIDIAKIPSHVIVTKHSYVFDELEKIESSLPVKLSSYDLKHVEAKIKSYKTNKKAHVELHKKITRQGGK